jgi:hypothetical protein
MIVVASKLVLSASQVTQLVVQTPGCQSVHAILGSVVSRSSSSPSGYDCFSKGCVVVAYISPLFLQYTGQIENI